MYIVGRMPDSELVIKTINASGESFSVLCGFRTASKKEILKSYRKLAVKWHPDQYKGDDKKKAEKMFIDVAAAKEVLTDPGKLNSLVCTVCSFLRSFERFVCYSFGRLRRLYGRSERSLGRSVVCPYGPFVRFYGRSVVCLFGQLVGWSFYLRFGRSFGCYLVCSFSQHDYIRLFVHLVQCSLFRFFVQSSIRLCSFVIVRVLVLPVVSSSVRFFFARLFVVFMPDCTHLECYCLKCCYE